MTGQITEMLDTIRAHLAGRGGLPPLASVELMVSPPRMTLQLAHADTETDLVHGLLEWAETLIDVSVRLRRHIDPDHTHVTVRGQAPGGVTVAVFGVVWGVDCALAAGREPGVSHDLTLDDLRGVTR